MKRKVYNLLIIMLFIIMIFSSIKITINYIKESKTETQSNTINTAYISKKITNKQLLKNYQIKYDNSDIKAILQIKGLNIEELIVQSTNNNYYLDHLVNKKYNKTGSRFIDYRTKINSKQINIYGHNSTIHKLPFNKLTKYIKREFYFKNKYISLITEDKTKKYEIFSVSVTNNEEHLKIKFKNNNEWLNHYYKLKNNSLYNTKVNIKSTDNILILQTCIFTSNKGNLLIISAKEI